VGWLIARNAACNGARASTYIIIHLHQYSLTLDYLKARNTAINQKHLKLATSTARKLHNPATLLD
jgi:hypothetical protein